MNPKSRSQKASDVPWQPTSDATVDMMYAFAKSLDKYLDSWLPPVSESADVWLKSDGLDFVQ